MLEGKIRVHRAAKQCGIDGNDKNYHDVATPCNVMHNPHKISRVHSFSCGDVPERQIPIMPDPATNVLQPNLCAYITWLVR